ncbi:methylmalonyl-CoA mutase [Marmoricola sp. URHA0025 HA25]
MTSPEDQGGPVALASGSVHTRADWEKIAAAVLRRSGRLTADDPDELAWEKLGRRTLDGIAVTPLGTPDLVDDLETAGRPDRVGEWDVRAWFADPDPKATAADVQTDLENGVTSVWLQVGAGGVPVEDLGTALAGVLLDVAPVVLDASDPVAAARAFAGFAGESARSTAGLADGTNLGADPLGALVRGTSSGSTTRSSTGWDDTVTSVARIAGDLGCLALVVDGTAVHDLGASDVQELAWTLAAGAAYLRVLVAGGHSVEEAAALLEFRYAATDDQFATIAKLRAARRLWARMLELSGVDTASPTACRQRQHVVTSRPMMTRYDPWVNMLRTCVAAFAAGVGGADAVTVLPFDLRLGLPQAFGRRIARNTSALLVHESHVARVTDPAGGAYAIEKLTDDLAVAAWEELGRIDGAEFEGHGGAEAAVRDGSLAERIESVVRERDAQIARRKRPITGLSEFPNLAETVPERRPYAEGAVPVRPYGRAFEELRDEPAEGKVFLATMGTVAAHTARATFASNLFAAGGVAVVNPGRADDVAAVLAAYTGPQGGQPVVCLTGADSSYAAWGAELVAALREAGARWVILAGKLDPSWGAEVDDTCAAGVDALDFLRRTREQLR